MCIYFSFVVYSTTNKRSDINELCTRSELHHLNYEGFYTILLEKNEELITVAIVRFVICLNALAEFHCLLLKSQLSSSESISFHLN